MGILQRLLDAIGFSKPKCKVLCVGLDNSGKSTVIQHLKPKQNAVREITPTVGFNVEQFSRSSINFTVFDMSGAGKYRTLWEHYYKDADAIVFVIDCSDTVANTRTIASCPHSRTPSMSVPGLGCSGRLLPATCADTGVASRRCECAWSRTSYKRFFRTLTHETFPRFARPGPAHAAHPSAREAAQVVA
jgi:GTPase SAR1 family protein